MRITKVNPHAQNAGDTIMVEHGGQEIRFLTRRLPGFRASPKREQSDLFHLLNQWYERQRPEQLKHLFDLYQQAFNALYTGATPKETQINAGRICSAVADFHDQGSIAMFLAQCPDYGTPSSVERAFVHQPGSPHTREGTYIAEDYLKLAAMSLVMRAVICLIGTFFARHHKNLNPSLAEFEAMRLFAWSKLVDSEAYHKLAQYVRINWHGSKPSRVSDAPLAADGHTRLQGGVALEMVSFDDSMQAITDAALIKRVCFGDISSSGDTSLVAYIHIFCRPQNTGAAGNTDNFNPVFKNPVSIRITTRSDDNKDQSRGLGILEQSPGRCTLTIGDISGINVSAKDPERVLQILPQDIDRQTFYEFREEARALISEPTVMVQRCQMIVVQWIMHPHFAPEHCMVLEGESAINIFAAAQAFLWGKGYHGLAALVGAIHIEVKEITGGRKPPLDQALIDKLKEVFPHAQSRQGKVFGRNNPAEAGFRDEALAQMQQHQVVMAVRMLANDFESSRWITTRPPKYFKQFDPNNHTDSLDTPAVMGSLRQQLVQLTIDLAHRRAANPLLF